MVVALVGTKTDLSTQRQVSSERAQGYARANGLLYAETSSYWNKFEGGDKDSESQAARYSFYRAI